MPAKHRIKTYEENAYYHLYNRGVNKQLIFQDDQDYGVFLSYLKNYLEKKDEKALQSIIANPIASWREKDHAIKLLRLNNFFNTISLVTHCLMPNHFHFLIRQTDANAIDRFMNSLCTRYTMFFNKKYKRIGPLFQSVYKAVMVTTDEQLKYLTRYIHRNPILKYMSADISSRILSTYQYSSYPEYLGLRNTGWIHAEKILAYFGDSSQKYQSFVEDMDAEENMVHFTHTLMLD
jgi:putative transposase